MTGPRLCLEELRYELDDATVTLEAPCQLEAGHLYLVEGPSGVGKSTLARTLLGLGACGSPPLRARGRVRLEGVEGPRGGTVTLWGPGGFQSRSRRELAFLPQLNALAFIDDLSPEANAGLFSRLPRRERRQHVERLARRFEVWPLPRSLARASGGQRMRISTVRALLPRYREDEGPSLLVADEPTVGLDPDKAHEVARTLAQVAQQGRTVVLLISHDPAIFLEPGCDPRPPLQDGTIRITACEVTPGGARPRGSPVAHLRAHERRRRESMATRLRGLTLGLLDILGALLLAPVALLAGLVCLDRTSFRAGLRSVVRTTCNPGTWLFVGAAAVVVGVTLAFFMFEKMPKREILEPLFLEEMLREFGLVMLLVLTPLFAALFATAKTGAAQAARLSSSVRTGLLEILTLAGIQPESYGLWPCVLGQTLTLAVCTILGMVLGVGAATLVFLGSGSELSLGLALEMMLGGLDHEEGWQWWLLARTVTCGVVAGILSALFGMRPARGRESDVSMAVHRTLLWTLLAVLAIQCAYIIAEFA